jgi:hypothetical protein
MSSSPLIQPSDSVPLPLDIRNDRTESNEERLRVAADTASLLAELGMPLEYSAKEEATARQLLSSTASTSIQAKAYNRGVAAKLAGLLNEYDHQIVKDAVQLRTYVQHRLLEISDCGDVKHELKALELLGKITDVGLFAEKSEITITHKTSSDLETAIKDRIKKLLGGEVIDVEPLGADLDEELGLIEHDEDPRPPATPPGELNLDVELGLVEEIQEIEAPADDETAVSAEDEEIQSKEVPNS